MMVGVRLLTSNVVVGCAQPIAALIDIQYSSVCVGIHPTLVSLFVWSIIDLESLKFCRSYDEIPIS